MSDNKVMMDAYAPGNGLRYEVMLVRYTDARGVKRTVFTWLNCPFGGRTMRLPAGSSINVKYMAEKMGGHCSTADLVAMMPWIRQHADVEVIVPQGYNRESGLPHKLRVVG